MLAGRHVGSYLKLVADKGSGWRLLQNTYNKTHDVTNAIIL
jgi:hypothetical protein